jgi:hypothetical protein
VNQIKAATVGALQTADKEKDEDGFCRNQWQDSE